MPGERKDDDVTDEHRQRLYGLELEPGHWLTELTTLTTATQKTNSFVFFFILGI